MELSLSELPQRLELARREIGARMLLAADFSGNLIDLATAEAQPAAPTLAALATGGLAASREITRLTGADSDSLQTLIIENGDDCTVLCGGTRGLTFVAVLGPDSMLGLARLEIQKLAEIRWGSPDLNLPRWLAPDLTQQILDHLEFDP